MKHGILLRTTSPAQANTLTRLAFLAQRRPHTRHLLDKALSGRLEELADLALEVAVDIGDPMGKVLAHRLDSEGNLELMHHLARRLSENPYASVLTLRDVSIVALRYCLGHYRESWLHPDDEQRTVLVAFASNLGQDLSYLGQWTEALAAFEEALEGLRSLADPAPSQVASCLRDYGLHLRKLGRRTEALEKSGEAVEIWRRLGNDLELASALNNLGADLSDLGRVRDALEVLTEAAGLYERHPKDLDTFDEHTFANTLICLGNQLGALGRFDEGRDTLERAVAIRRRLAADLHSAFRPDLAIALTDLALLLYGTDREEQARKVIEEARAIYREIAEDRNETFGSDLAWSISRGLSRSELSTPGQMTQEIDLLQQAIELFRRRARDHPLTFEPLLAESLHILGEQLEETGQPELALTALDEALELLRRMIEDPRYGAQLDHLGWSLIHRSNALGSLGRWSEAIENAREAVDVFLCNAEDSPMSRGNLAAARHELGIQLSLVGLFEEGLGETRASVQLYRRLVSEQPGVFQVELSSALMALGNQLHAAERLEEAVSVSRQAVEHCRRLVDQRGEGYLETLAISLSNLSLRLRYTGQSQQALVAVREAVEIYRGSCGGFFFKEENYAESLHNLGTILNDQEQVHEARFLFEEAVGIRRQLAEELPEAFGVDLAYSLLNLGATLNAEGDHASAVDTDEEAVALLRRVVEEGRDHLQPELGIALANLAHQLCELRRSEESLAVSQEALEILVPWYSGSREDVRQATLLAASSYLEGATECGVEPDLALVGSLLSAVDAETTSFDSNT